MRAGEDRQRSPSDAKIFRRIAVVGDEKNSARKYAEHQSRFYRGRAERRSRQPVRPADRTQSKERDNDEFAERRVGDRPWSPGVGPPGADRGEPDQQARPTAHRP